MQSQLTEKSGTKLASYVTCADGILLVLLHAAPLKVALTESWFGKWACGHF